MGKLWHIRRLPALLAALAVAGLTIAAFAIADNLVADGDGVAPVGNNDMSFGSISCDQDSSKTALLAVNRNGAAGSTNVFKDSSTATLSVVSVTGANASAVSASIPAGSNTIAIPSNWGTATNNTLTPGTVSSTVTVHPTASGAGTATVTYQASGVNSSNSAISRTDTMVVSWTAGSCVPPDTTAPSSSASATKDGGGSYTFGDWTNKDVTVTLSGQDNAGGSGLKEIRYTTDGTTPSASVGTVYSSPFTISDEGTTTVKFVAIDNAGNVETPVNSRAVKIDKTDPQVSCGSADSDWHADDVTIGCTASDGPSGLADSNDATFNLVTNVAANTDDSNAATDSRTVYDNAGNSSTAGPISGNKVDKKAPSVDCGSADGDWHADDVSIGCTSSDGSGSGLADSGDAAFNLVTNVAAGTESANASTNSHAVADAVGNTSTAGPVSGNKVDKKGPAITCDTAPTFTLNQSPANVTGTATDGGSGPASQSLSKPADTSKVGPASVTLAADDNVGNHSTKGCSYDVDYNWSGFFQPVDNNGVLNKAKAGSAIPVKFSLDGTPQPGSNTPGDGGAASIMQAGYPTSGVINCSPTAVTDPIEETLTAGGSSLTYDRTADQWVYVWKTLTSYAGTCRQLVVKLADGNEHRANFNFTR